MLPAKLFATAWFLKESKKIASGRSSSTIHNSGVPANWVKIGPVDVLIKGRTESLTREKKEHEHFISPPSAHS